MTGRTLIDEWLSLFASRDEVADVYADLLLDKGAEWKTWPTINLAIIDRWSESGLRYIKTRAWKIAAERSREAASTAPGVPDGSPETE